MLKDISTMRSVTKFFAFLCLLVFGQAAVAQTSGSVTYVYTDPQGTPLAEANSSGAITATFDYTPYGTTALGTPPNGPGYTGHVNDPETNLVYMQARYYDPATGRFLSTDSIAPAAGDQTNFNRYGYGDDDPVGHDDPTGDYAEGLSGAQISCEVYNLGNCGTKANTSTNSNSTASVSSTSQSTPSNSHTSGWQWIAIGFSNALCNMGVAASCSEDEHASDPEPSNSHEAGLVTAGGLIAGVGVTAATGGEGAEVSAEEDAFTLQGFTKHGINRAIGDGGSRAGAKPSAILDALKNPTKIKSGVDNQGRPFSIYTGANARVVVNPQTRQIISVNPLSGAGAH